MNEIYDRRCIAPLGSLFFLFFLGFLGMKTNPQVDAYLKTAKRWRNELTQLRRILLDCELTEELKWRVPCYAFQKSNIAIIGELKECCTLSFFKGALLNDPHGILVKPGENTRAARLIRFTSVQEIVELETVLEAYIHEAIEVDKAGLKVDFKKNRDLIIPEELQIRFEANPALETAFAALTPGRQRAYVLYFSAPKQTKTRTSRVEKYTRQILDGKGFNDCTCGLSHKLPACDGSHKQIR